MRQMMLGKDREMTRQFEIRMQRATKQEKEKARRNLEEQRNKMKDTYEKQLAEERKSYNTKMRESYAKDNDGELKRIHARQELRLDDSKVNIALAGESGAGKSSLLNGLRDIRTRATPGYAPESPAQSQRTVATTAYQCSSKPMQFHKCW